MSKPWAERLAAGWRRPKRTREQRAVERAKLKANGYKRAKPAKPKASYLDREVIFWDGEGITLEAQSGMSRAEWKRFIDQTAELEYLTYQARYAPLLDAIAQHGGIEPSSYDSRVRYDMVPAKWRKPWPRSITYGNLDLIAQTYESLCGIPATGDDILEEISRYRSRPSLAALRQEVKERNGHNAPAAGQHAYVLLADSTGGALENYERGLTTAECFERLLATAASHPRAVHVGFALHYDFDMMLGSFDRRQIVRLRAASKGGVNVWVDGRRYRVTYRPRKFLRVADDHRTITLYDAFGFFQASFVRACHDWLDDSTRERLGLESIHAMKQKRALFTAADRAEILTYCRAELAAGVALIDELRSRVKVTGIPLKNLGGAGALAGAMMQQHNVKSAIAPDPIEWREAIAGAYFGGRIEAMVVGYHDAPVWEHDIRSAYPAEIAELPDLAGATWQEGTIRSRWTLYDLEWDLPTIDQRGDRIPFFPLPYRLPNDGVIFPAIGRGWVWAPEYHAAEEWCAHYGGDLRILRSVSLVPTDPGARPFAFVPELYETRARWKRAGIGAEKVLKLGLNSLYGRCCQQIGAIVQATGVKPPPYFSLTWAGLVTSGTRARLLRAAMRNPESVIMFMTDGLYATMPIDPGLGEGLGQWERSELEAIAIAQPGVYWKRKEGHWESKVRGFNREGLDTPDRILTSWRSGTRDLSIPTTRFVTTGTAVASPAAWATWRRWITEPRIMDLTGDSLKREGVRSVRPLAYKLVRTPPRPNHLGTEPSKAYDVAFWRGARVAPDVERTMQDETDMLYE